ncbi:MAG: ferritin-like domain-containing protein [Polyangiaceae bacterium]|nr:ferritin-like domain-containing protein [Polyangiaceae bacterium]
MSSESLHEPADVLSTPTKDMHRAIVSLREELEAIDWYQQRAEACSDDGLRAVLVHNKNEETEHAMMVLEWIRRHDPVFADNVKKYLGSTGPITQVEQAMGPRSSEATDTEPSLGIGSLKERDK